MKNILKYTFLLLILFFLTDLVRAQKFDTRDIGGLKRILNDSTSGFYYAKLKAKVKNQPSALTKEDCFLLYYGQIYQKGYNPLSSFINPLKIDFDKAIIEGNCKKVIELGSVILDQNPVEITTLLHVSTCIRELNSRDTIYFYEKRFKNLLDGIFSTGDGKSLLTAIKIVNLEDDLVLKSIIGLLGGNEEHAFANNHAYSIWNKADMKLYFEDIVVSR